VRLNESLLFFFQLSQFLVPKRTLGDIRPADVFSHVMLCIMVHFITKTSSFIWIYSVVEYIFLAYKLPYKVDESRFKYAYKTSEIGHEINHAMNFGNRNMAIYIRGDKNGFL